MPDTESRAGKKQSIADRARAVRDKVKDVKSAKRPGTKAAGDDRAKAKADSLGKGQRGH